jgi:hypothetical protein
MTPWSRVTIEAKRWSLDVAVTGGTLNTATKMESKTQDRAGLQHNKLRHYDYLNVFQTSHHVLSTLHNRRFVF